MMTRINDVDYLFDDDVEISVQQFEIAEAMWRIESYSVSTGILLLDRIENKSYVFAYLNAVLMQGDNNLLSVIITRVS